MKRVVITGATSGLGKELALQYAGQGATHIAITGRREGQLLEVAQACRVRGAHVETYAVDVRDQAAMKDMAQHFVDKAGGCDLVIANAGMAVEDELSKGDPEPMTRLLDVNILGVVNTLLPYVPTMVAQGHGHLTAVASVAGYRAVPNHTAYAASKMAVRCLMDGFGYDLDEMGIHTTVINPGFVVSEITDKNQFAMPFLMETSKACRLIRRAIERRKRSYTFPWQWRYLLWAFPLLPRWAVDRFMRSDGW